MQITNYNPLTQTTVYAIIQKDTANITKSEVKAMEDTEITKKEKPSFGKIAAGVGITVLAALGAVALAFVKAMSSGSSDSSEDCDDRETPAKRYKILFNGEEQDETFDSEEAAEEYAMYLRSCSREGAEILHLSNPGDYDEDDYDDDYEIVED